MKNCNRLKPFNDTMASHAEVSRIVVYVHDEIKTVPQGKL